MPVKKDKRELNLEDFEAQAIEALGQSPSFTLTLTNGETIKIPHPMLLDDDRQAAVDIVRSREDLDKDADGKPTNLINGQPAPPFNVRFARAVLGDEEHARFLAAGGKSNLIPLAWELLTKNEADDPK